MDLTFLISTEPRFIFLRIFIVVFLTVSACRIVLYSTRKIWEQKLHYLLLRKIIVVLIVILGTLLALGQFPDFDNVLATILTGSGIAALAISLAAQQSLSNFISGMVISASKPFEVGDRVRLINGEITGNVENITLRHTVVRTFLNSRVIIPNSVINNEMIENSTIVEERASNFLDVIITYDSDMEKAMEIMAEIVGNHPNYVDARGPGETDQPKVPVFVRSLSVYGVELRSSVCTQSIVNNFVTCSDIRHQIKLEYDRAGIKFVSAPIASPPHSG